MQRLAAIDPGVAQYLSGKVELATTAFLSHTAADVAQCIEGETQLLLLDRNDAQLELLQENASQFSFNILPRQVDPLRGNVDRSIGVLRTLRCGEWRLPPSSDTNCLVMRCSRTPLADPLAVFSGGIALQQCEAATDVTQFCVTLNVALKPYKVTANVTAGAITFPAHGNGLECVRINGTFYTPTHATTDTIDLGDILLNVSNATVCFESHRFLIPMWVSERCSEAVRDCDITLLQ
jgi:hypothetical protein